MNFFAHASLEGRTPLPSVTSIAGTMLALALVFVPAESRLAAAAPGIETFDFGNATVFFGGSSHRLRHGHLAEPDPQDSILRVWLNPPVFGSIAGYPGEIAAVLIYSGDTGATGMFSELNLFAMRGGKPWLVADLPGGDRAEGGLHAAKISGGRLVVDVYAPPPSGGVCCPGFVDTIRYRLVGRTLVRDGKPVRRPAVENTDY